MLRDKIVLITGASSGIGASCATYFAKAQAKLLLCARRVDVVNKLAEQLKQDYDVEIYTFKLDVSHHAEVKATLKALPENWQQVDILFNNAGLAAGLDPLQEGNVEDWEEMINTNIKGLLYVTREILPQMVRRNAGHIINMGSIAGHHVYPKGAVYAATKFAVNALSQGLRMDLLGTKIRVSSVDPGAVETNFSNVRFKGDANRSAMVYEGFEPLTPDDIADAVLYCATRPSHINISEVIIMPTAQASATMISRETS
ncbi:MAG: SDR family oxidoreductase [Gammaproteobacteria bacterium]|nr:SDR family oxidoreductase [Gammaproteobacteria bacterium]